MLSFQQLMTHSTELPLPLDRSASHPPIGRSAVARLALVAIFGSFALPAASEPIDSASAKAVSFTQEAWDISGEGSVVETVDGREALRLKSGRAILREMEFEDGTIEFDLQHTHYRSFIYVQFRLESDREYEEIYFRAHKSLLPDTVQYTPVFRGSSQWQIFHDEDATAPARLSPGEWTPVKIIVKGTQAAVFVGDVSEPQLVVPRLARGKSRGEIALRAQEPGRGYTGRPEGLFTASFANLRISSSTSSYEFPEVEPVISKVKGSVESWELSKAFDPGSGAVLKLPEEILRGEWAGAKSEESGVVLLAREVAKPDGVRRATVLARTTIDAVGPSIVPFSFGYSDEVSVFLNGHLLFTGDRRYSFNLPRRQGLLTLGESTLYLPLSEGVNEVILAVTDVFGGWGVTAEWGDPQ